MENELKIVERWVEDQFEASLQLVQTHRLEIAGRPVLMRSIGDGATSKILDSIAHLEKTPTGPLSTYDLKINVYGKDASAILASTRSGPGAPQYQIDASSNGTYVLDQGEDYLIFLNRVEHRLTAIYSKPELMTNYLIGKPFRWPLSIWLRDIHAPLIHAGMITRGGRALFLCGRPTAGKSTVSLAALQRGWQFLGDDLISVEEKNGDFWGSCIYASSFLRRESLGHFKENTPITECPSAFEMEKFLVQHAKQRPTQVIRNAPIGAIVMLKFDPACENPEIKPYEKSRVLATLGSTSPYQFAGIDKEAMKLQFQLVAKVPCYEMTYGKSMDRACESLSQLWEKIQ